MVRIIPQILELHHVRVDNEHIRVETRKNKLQHEVADIAITLYKQHLLRLYLECEIDCLDCIFQVLELILGTGFPPLSSHPLIFRKIFNTQDRAILLLS